MSLSSHDRNQKQNSRFELLEQRLALSAQSLLASGAFDGSTEHHYAERAEMTADPVGDFQIDRFDDPLEALHGDLAPLLNDSHALTGLNAVRTAYGFDGRSQTVAIIDSGIAYDHVALGGGLGSAYRVVGGWDFAENDANPYDDGPAGFHGTHVAGIVGSSDATYRGVASGVDLVALRVFDDQGSGYFHWTEQALQWVHQHRNDFEHSITTVNLSLGASWNGNTPPSWAMLEDEFAQLKGDGIFISVSAGNSFTTYNSTGLSYPAASSHVVPVASVDNNGSLSYFSQRNSRVIAAPGRNIVSTVPDYVFGADGVKNDFASASGTSMAAPYLSGAAALAREAMQFVGLTNITQDTLYGHFRNTADVIYDSATNANYFRLNIQRAIDTLMPADDFGNTAETANQLGTVSINTQFSGIIGRKADVDYVEFVAGRSGRATFRVEASENLDAIALAPQSSNSTQPNEVSFDVIQGQSYVVGVTSNDSIGRFNASLEIRVTQTIVKTCVGNNGTVYCLMSDGIVSVDGRNIWSNTRDFEVLSDGTLIWQGNDDLLQRRVPGGAWETLHTNASKFATRNDGSLYVLDTDGGIWVNGQHCWANTRDMHLGADGSLYLLGTNGLLQQLPPGGSWESLQNNVAKVGMYNGALYVLDWDGGLSVNGRLVWLGTRDMHLAVDGTLYWQGTNGTLQRLVQGGQWETLGTDVTEFAVGWNGSLFVLDNRGTLTLDGLQIRSETRDIQLQRDGALYWLGTDGLLQKRAPTDTWETLQSNITQFAVNGRGVLYALDTEGWVSVNGRRVWSNTRDMHLCADGTFFWQSNYGLLQRLAPGQTWETLQEDAIKFSVREDGALFVLGADNQLSVNGRKVWGNTRDMQLSPDGTLYWLGMNDLLQRLPKGGSWETVDSNVVTLVARNDGTPLWLSRQGVVKVNGVETWTGIRSLRVDSFGRLQFESTNGAAIPASEYVMAALGTELAPRSEMDAIDSIFFEVGIAG